jgi:hypothetical protein
MCWNIVLHEYKVSTITLWFWDNGWVNYLIEISLGIEAPIYGVKL